MIKKISKLKDTILISFKILIFLMFGVVFTVIAYQNYLFTKFFSINLGTSTSTFGALFLIFNYIYDGFKLGENKISDVVYSLSLSAIISLIFTYFQLCILFHEFLSFWPILIIMIADVALSIVSSILYSYVYDKFFPPKTTIIIYSEKTDLDLILKKVYSRPDKYIVVDKIHIGENLKYIFQKINNIDLIILCDINLEYREKIIERCYKNNIEVYFRPVVSDIIINNASFHQISDTPILTCNYKELTLEQKFFKRIFDIFFALIMLGIAWPIMIITAIIIKLYDGGPVFFTQDRVTIHNKIFKLYKFRSMIVDAEKDGVARLALKNDQRITPVGKIIRMLRIDELPQIINILKGDMSIVGPRPERPELIAQNILDFPAFEYRTKVKAGMTGFAQIKGKYNTPYLDKLMMDLMYIESYSIFLDLKLIFLTIKIIFIPESSEGI
ncbi:MAG: exopolysaccharide biosynthesis polyprenyl glycosylphosphotransferase [Oscillospiraceae bacterium]|nr:exopolysaccharide biosynthesis polyprenyl glycosylphosphotransferase [Oscillospiraceae bacterium]